MHRIPKALCLLSLLLAFGHPGMAFAQGPSRADCVAAGLKSCKPLNDFVAKLRAAVKANDKGAVADLISYPPAIQVKKNLKSRTRTPSSKTTMRSSPTPYGKPWPRSLS